MVERSRSAYANPSGHEPPDLAVGKVAASGIVLGIIVLAASGVLYLVAGGSRSPERNARDAHVLSVPQPRLEPDPHADFERYVRAKQQLLDRYAWVDRAHGVVRIPIDRAMDILATRAATAPPEAEPAR